MMKPAFFACFLACGALSLWSQSAAQIDGGSQPAVSALRALAQNIKECRRTLSSEKKWGNRSGEIERWYVGPPQNVLWDVAPSSSVRSPYVGYIEFSLPYDHWVPDDVRDKYMRSDAGIAYPLALASSGPMKYRYEFDIGPSGLELTRMLRHGQNASGQYPTEWFDVSPDGDTCWENAARKIQTKSQQAETSQATSSDIPRNVDIQDSGKAFAEVCSAADNASPGEARVAAIGLCGGYLEGVLGGLDLASTMLGHDDKSGRRFRDQIVYCPAEGGTPRTLQIVRIVVKYIQANPQAADLSPARLAVAALRQSFPCEKK